MNQDGRVFLDPPELDETEPNGKGRRWQGGGIGNGDRVDEGWCWPLNDNGVEGFLVGASEDLLSTSSCGESGKRCLSLETGETDNNLNFS